MNHDEPLHLNSVLKSDLGFMLKQRLLRTTIPLVMVGNLISPVSRAQAADETTITTPRGATVQVTLHPHQGESAPLVVVAPGQGCNSKRALFEQLAARSEQAGFTVVRFEWNYCNSNPTNPQPSADLAAEIEDMTSVLQYGRTLPNVDRGHVYLVGKSLGSVVAQRVFAATPDSRALVLLTPLCSATTDAEGQPLPAPAPVLDETYPGLKGDRRPVLFLGGNQDPLCFLPHLYSYLGDSAGNILAASVVGNHRLEITGADGTVDQAKSTANVSTAMDMIVNWLALQ